MKSILKFLNLLALIMLALLLGLRDVLPAKAVAPDQTITIMIHAPSSAANGESFTVDATADSELAVTYSAVGVCTNIGATFTITGDSGTCTVQYDQAGDGTYDPAPQVTENVAAQPVATATATSTETSTGTVTPTETSTPTLAPTGTPTPTVELDTPSPTATASKTATPTATATETAIATATATASATATSIGPGLFVSNRGNDQGGANLCTNRTTPCQTIQQAITKAVSGNTIFVTADTFYGTGTSPIITINKNINISGGWNSAFNAQASLTLLNGQDIRLDVVVNTNVTAIIEKFIITNSVASGVNNMGILTIRYSMILNNDKPDNTDTSASDGGGIYNTGTLVVANSAIYGNHASQHSGGGIFNTGSLTVINSTIANNDAIHGGGIMYTPTGYVNTPPLVILRNVTLSGNTANYGSSIYRASDISPVFLQDPILYNSIMANNNCHGTITSANNNLIYQSDGCAISGSYGTDNPLLGAFSTDKGYFPLLHDSPAIDTGSLSAANSGADACQGVDQFGTIRSLDGNGDTVAVCDIGAYEADSSVSGITPTANTAYIINGGSQASQISTVFSTPLSVLVKDQFDAPITGIIITFTAPASDASGTFSNSGTNTTTAITDSNGVATAAVFMANTFSGSYTVNASVPGLSNFVQFWLVNTGIASSISVNDGSLQSAGTTSGFRKQLSVLVKDQLGVSLSGVMVTFTAPASGASGKFSDSGTNITTAITNANGIAIAAVFTANTVMGRYKVAASVSGVLNSTQFDLANAIGTGLYVSPTGNDNNTCSFPTIPCRTINAAIGKATAGDTISVASGTYTGTNFSVVKIAKSITLSGGWNPGFSAQTGMSTIDGQHARRAIETDYAGGITRYNIYLDHFIITRGAESGLYNNIAILTISNSIITGNNSSSTGGGIYNRYGSTLTLNNSIVNGNRGGNGGSGGGGGGGIYNDGLLILNNSTVSANKIIGSFQGSGINNSGTATLNNTTISFNTGADGIYNSDGTLNLNNSTVYGNQFSGIAANGWLSSKVTLNNSTISGNGIGIHACLSSSSCIGNVFLKNSIVAGNTQDCLSKIISVGYNLIGNTTDCIFSPKPGDITNVNAKLGKLIGLPGYIPVIPSSPAVNAGNRLTCLATDQRGVTRPQGSTCDIGAYEYKMAGPAASFHIATGSEQKIPVKSPYLPLAVYVVDRVGSPVKGVKITFNAPASGSSGTFANTRTYTTTAITDSNGLAVASTFTANNWWGTFNVTASAAGLTSSLVFSLANLAIPTIISPVGHTWDMTPTFTWSKIAGASQYRYELREPGGSIPLYTKIVPVGVCGVITCSNTPITTLSFYSDGSYSWRVAAMVNGTWVSFSEWKLFNLKPANGLWSEPGLEFYVTPEQSFVKNFAIYISVAGCGNYKITQVSTVLIYYKSFNINSNLYATGYFDTTTSAHGTVGLYRYYIPGCGYVSGGPFTWAATWKNGTQPAAVSQEGLTPFLVKPEPSGTAMPGSYKVERVNP